MIRGLTLLSCLVALAPLVSHAAPGEAFFSAAREKHGEAGERAARFLTEHMPPRDRDTLSDEFLLGHLNLAMQARTEFPWAKQVPEEIFLNDVLPYAVFDETREAWRAEMLERARGIVAGAKTAGEAAQVLNRELFDAVKVHYDTGRKRPNQSPAESMESGKATCTGLSVLLVDACRAVGIPARAVGTPLWANKRGNHTWVEIWDGGWHFTGADEYDKEGLDRGWFTADAARAEADLIEHAIYATSWKREGGVYFPLVWQPQYTDVGGVNVTARYARPAVPVAPSVELGVRLLDGRGERLIARAAAVDAAGRNLGQAETKAGTADMNDMPRFALKAGEGVWLRFTREGETRETAAGPYAGGTSTLDATWDGMAPVPDGIAAVEAWLAAEGKGEIPAAQAALGRGEAERMAALLARGRADRLAAERKSEMETKTITAGEMTLRWMERTFGDEPSGGHSLWISMHGGGEAPKELNDSQWQNQIRLYEPAEGFYVAPRAPTNTWNLWHESHIDPMLQRLIEDYVIFRDVNPDRVYLMGYSAGGDGVWQLAPRMADRFAAAAMMAGHPNEASLLGLRNLPFALFMGAQDSAVGRNKVAAEKSAALDQLQHDDPGGYVHMARIYEGLGHWMNGKDSEALPWMSQYARNPWPKTVVWFQDEVTHDRYYWLKIPDKTAAKAGDKLVARVEGQTIRLQGLVPADTELRLSDRLLDLDQEITVMANGNEIFRGKAARNLQAIRRSLDERLDLPAACTAILKLPPVAKESSTPSIE